VTLGDVRGQDRALGLLERAISSKRLAHAFVFAGPPGVGKRSTALALARAKVCTEAPDRGCGRCAECLLVSAGTHPDVFVEDLAAAQAERASASFVSIEQIRRVCAALAMRPVRGACKLAIVDQAERMTAEAQNALLKTLEEPRGQATLVLVSSNLDALLPTIRSRCQRLLFAPLPDEVVVELLEREGVAADDARRAAPLAGGSLDRARELASAEASERTAELYERFARLPRLSIPDRLDLAASMSPRGERNRAQQALTHAAVLEHFRRQVLAAAEASRPPDAGAEDESMLHERLAGVRRAARQLERAYATVRDLERNANANLAWDGFVLGFDARDAG